MRVSVIIVTYRRPADLDEALASVVAQRRAPDEVIVVAQPDDAATRPVVEAYAAKTGGLVRLVRNDRGDALTIARNVGVAAASGDLLVFLDDDVVLDPGYLGTLVGFFEEHPDVLGAQGFWGGSSRSPGRPSTWFCRFFLLSRIDGPTCRILPSGHVVYPRHPPAVATSEWLSGCNMAYRRSVFRDRGFDERLARGSWGEDVEFSYALGKRAPGSLALVRDARLEHRTSPESRPPVRTLVHLRMAHWAYIRHRHFPRGPGATLAHLVSRVGELLLLTGIAFLAEPRARRPRAQYLAFWLSGLPMLLRHRSSIAAGQFDFLRDRLRY